MPSPTKIIAALHDLHPWGGQDKSNLEIFYHLNKDVSVDIHSYQFVDNREWPRVTHHKYSAPFSRPILLKSMHYTVASALRLRKQYGKAPERHRNGVIIQSTGTSSSVTDVVQVQYIHKVWQLLKKQLSLPAQESSFRQLYHWLDEHFNVLMENLVFTPDKRYIAISHGIKKELMEHFKIPNNRIETIYHGVSTDQFHPHAQSEKSQQVRSTLRAEMGLREGDVALLHIGALNQRKGVPDAIRTLGFLQKEGVDNVYYVAVGQGDRSALDELAREYGVTKKIKFISHSKNVRDYYWAADLFFFPSIYEPFGLVVLEAMASGLPCLVSGATGASELIEHGENGLLIENILDPQSMANQLMTLIKQPLLLSKLGTNAHRLAMEHSWEKVAKRYYEYYQSIL